MAELLQPKSEDGLSESELALNQLRQARAKELEDYTARKQYYLGRTATEAGVVPTANRYDAQEATRAEIGFHQHETRQ